MKQILPKCLKYEKEGRYKTPEPESPTSMFQEFQKLSGGLREDLQ